MRYGFFFASRSAADLQALPGCTAHADGVPNAPLLRVTWAGWPFAGHWDRDFMVRHRAAVTLAGQTWQLWHVLPVGQNWRLGPAAFRLLRRCALQNARLKGPWRPKALERLSEALADEHCYPQRPVLDAGGNIVGWEKVPGAPMTMPLVCHGDDPVREAELDYDPSDADCNADVEPEVP